MNYIVLLILILPKVLCFSIDRSYNTNQGLSIINLNSILNGNTFKQSGGFNNIIRMSMFELEENEDEIVEAEDCSKLYIKINDPPSRFYPKKLCLGPQRCRDAKTPLDQYYHCKIKMRSEESGRLHVADGCDCGYVEL